MDRTEQVETMGDDDPMRCAIEKASWHNKNKIILLTNNPKAFQPYRKWLSHYKQIIIPYMAYVEQLNENDLLTQLTHVGNKERL